MAIQNKERVRLRNKGDAKQQKGDAKQRICGTTKGQCETTKGRCETVKVRKNESAKLRKGEKGRF